MKKRILVFALCVLAVLILARHARAETYTVRWDPVATFTDGSSITGSYLPVSYNTWWSTSSTFVTPHNVLSWGQATSVQFDVAIQGMVRGTTIYFGVRARTATLEESFDSSPYSWLVPNLTLVSIAIDGPASVNENSTGTYTAVATWSDGSTTTITPTWSEDSSYATISAGGVLTTSEITSNQAATVTASYTSGGVTQTDTHSVNIVNVPKMPSTPTSIIITRP